MEPLAQSGPMNVSEHLPSSKPLSRRRLWCCCSVSNSLMVPDKLRTVTPHFIITSRESIVIWDHRDLQLSCIPCACRRRTPDAASPQDMMDLHSIMDIPQTQMDIISWVIEVGICPMSWLLACLPLSPQQGAPWWTPYRLTQSQPADTRWHHRGPGERHNFFLVLCECVCAREIQ